MASTSGEDASKRRPRRRRQSAAESLPRIAHYVPAETVAELAGQRRWALGLDPESMQGIEPEVRMLRQALRDAFVLGENSAVRQHAEALRRLLREAALVPEMADEEGGLEDGLSADLRRILQRVGVEMGADA